MNLFYLYIQNCGYIWDDRLFIFCYFYVLEPLSNLQFTFILTKQRLFTPGSQSAALLGFHAPPLGFR
jgi:hypothetical protein